MAGRYPDAAAINAVFESLHAGSIIQIAKQSGVAKTKVAIILNALREAGVLTRKNSISKKKRDTNPALLSGILDRYRAKKENDHEKLKSMIVYAQSALCRWKMMLKYFGQEADWERCGHCDNCGRTASTVVEK